MFVYDIIGSDLDENRIQVAHWTILGGQRVTSVADRVPGAIYDLDIELFDEHLELATERILMEGVDPRLPFYYDVTNP